MDFSHLTEAKTLAQLLTTAMLAVLFIQSGLDKVFNYSGNVSWFKDHFKKSFLGPTVPLLMPVITLTEVLAGVLSATGFIFILLKNESEWGMWGSAVAGLALLMLFFGQRIAQDYGGAATLVPYFLMALAGVWLCG
ncbi:MAG: DoxX family membrane protein [Bacteroidia bacterium]